MPADAPPAPFRAGPFPRSILPEYGGLGLANVVPTFEGILGIETAIAPLAPEVLPPPLVNGVRRCVLLVIDALGAEQFTEATARGHTPYLSALAQRPDAHLATITSTFPSTTVCALTTLGSGLPPGRHAVVSHVLYDPELGATLDILRFAPVLAGRSLDREGVEAGAWLGLPTVFERLAPLGVATTVVNHRAFEGTALSRINHRGARFEGFYTLSDLCANLRAEILRDDGPAYVHAYWGTLDSVAHGYGPDSAQHAAEVRAVDWALGELLLASLHAPDTLLLITADHGHVASRPDHTIWLNDHPDLLALLQSPPAGLDRAGMLYVRPGRAAEARGYVEGRLGEQVDVLSREESLALGLYGPAPLSPKAEARIGELLLLPRADWLVKYARPGQERKSRTIGKHGGLSPREMLVPLLALRLG